tara:strand:+ start:1636 stop:2292 length:657 start_codon:yes stop_codon:yes gene_type:complete
MVNKRLTEIANRLGSENLDRKEIIPVRNKSTDYKGEIDGFSYVPNLGFYVADRTSWDSINWYKCKEIMKARNSFMLTPADFWKYYDFVSENRVDIVGDMKESFENEWLDALVIDRRHLLVTPEFSPGDKSYIGGTEYRESVPLDSGSFDPINASKETGLPAVFYADEDQGDFLFKPNYSSEITGIVREGGNKIRLNAHITASDTHPYRGVRECKRLEQ